MKQRVNEIIVQGNEDKQCAVLRQIPNSVNIKNQRDNNSEHITVNKNYQERWGDCECVFREFYRCTNQPISRRSCKLNLTIISTFS